MSHLDRQEVIRRLCRLQALVWKHKIAVCDAADCFCGEGGFWGCENYGGTYKKGYRNSGECLEFIEKAVKEKLGINNARPPD